MSIEYYVTDFTMQQKQRSATTKMTKNKFNSLDRGSGIIHENDFGVSPILLKKNWMSISSPCLTKAQIMQAGPVGNHKDPSEALMGHSESNHLLAPPLIYEIDSSRG